MFSIKKTVNNFKKKIFLKHFIVINLFYNIFFLNFFTKILFCQKKVKLINILKAPARHKKFFHQVGFEVFSIKVLSTYTPYTLGFFNKFQKKLIFEKSKNNFKKFLKIFIKLLNLLNLLGSNSLFKTSTVILFKTKFNIFQ